jgi:hypothetical protein
VLNPLDFEAFSVGSTYVRFDELDLGVRIGAAVPESSTLVLLGLGLVGIAALVRRSPRTQPRSSSLL